MYEDGKNNNTDKVSESSPIVGHIRQKFQQSETSKIFDEKRWLKSYRNYRGLYGPEMAFRENEKSRVFVKVTKTKVLAAFGQIIEVLFSQGKFPIGIEPTPVPEDTPQYAHLKPKPPQPPQDPYGFNGDAREIPPGATADMLMENLAQEYKNLGFDDGPAPDLKTMPQIEPAMLAAEKMQKLVHDQLEETQAITTLRHVFFEMCLLGTGILKGPFTSEKRYHSFSKEDDMQVYMQKVKTVPKLEAVSCWNFYPDPNATSLEDCDYVIQRHSLNRQQFSDLRYMPMFSTEMIDECLKDGPNYQVRGYESSLYDRETVEQIYKNRFEVLEYWGVVNKDLANECGIETDSEIVNVNAWICGNKVLRMVENPFTPTRIPFTVCPYELNPYQFFGIGVAENMEDSQQIMNGHARMAIDNLALSGNLVFDVDETQLVPGQDMKIFPGKIFRRQSGQPGTAINSLKFPNSTQENMMMFDRFRQLADEATGIPSYSHGQTGVTGMTRTAAGMSMLMGAAALSIKTVIKNIDDYLLKPLGENFFLWNMQFSDDVPEIKGDLAIKARGTSSLMQKEVRSQRLTTFMQTCANPSLAPFVKWHTILKEVAKTLDIDPEQVINDPEKAAIYAHIMGAANGTQNNTAPVGEQSSMAAMGGVPPGASPTDPTGNGGGNIGTGNIPMPGEAGFASPTTTPRTSKQEQ
jgi:hypothetical protein